MSEEIKKIAEQLKDNQYSLRINRLPKKTKESFKKLAEEEFCSDFGFTLKWLMEGLIDKDMVECYEKISELEQRLVVLENKKPEEEKPVTMLSGRRIGRKK